MITYTPQSRPALATFTKQTRNYPMQAGKFSVGRFGKARYGSSDGYQKQARATASFTKSARP